MRVFFNHSPIVSFDAVMNNLYFIKTAVLLFSLITFKQSQSQTVVFSKDLTDSDLIQKILAARFDTSTNRMKWLSTAAEIVEYSGEGGDGFLYSNIDTVFYSGDSVKLIIFHTASLKMIGNIIISSNSCQNCGVNVGYAELMSNNNSWQLNRFRKNIGVHGSFGENNYRVSIASSKRGNIILRLDEFKYDTKREMVLTTFYKNATRVAQTISEENNEPAIAKNKRGYYSYSCNFILKDKETIREVKKGYRIDRKTGKKINIYNVKEIHFNSFN